MLEPSTPWSIQAAPGDSRGPRQRVERHPSGDRTGDREDFRTQDHAQRTEQLQDVFDSPKLTRCDAGLT